MSKVRWGILGTAKIAREKVIPALQRGQHTVVTALASRDGGAAREVADRLGIPAAYGSYEALLADPEIDAVYNPLPNHLHVPWSVRALKAGKHVLCEKPIAPTVVEARILLKAAHAHPHLKVMEAFMYRFHPQWELAREMVLDGRIGTLQTVQAFFSYYLLDPGNIRNAADKGGGGLLDIGCYPVSVARFLFGSEPERVCGVLSYDHAMGIDCLGSGILDFGRGQATFTYGTQLAPYQRVHIVGSEGRLEVEIPFNAPPDRPCRLFHHRKGEVEEILLPVANQYTLQGDAFARAVLGEAPVPTPLEDAVANMQVIEAIVESARRGVWVRM